MTLVLKNASNTKSVKLAWSKEAVKYLASMGAKPETADASPLATELTYIVADPNAVSIALNKVCAKD